MEDYLRVGVITTTHGLKGEVKVFPTTDPERFESLRYVLIRTAGQMRRLDVAGYRFFKNLVILRFAGIDSIDQIEKYKGHDLWIAREDAQELEDGEYYIGDLIGMEVWLEDGTRLGTVRDVLETGANDVYEVVTADGEEILLPAIDDCIREIDLENNRMTIHPMKGLLS
ncbi:MAG: 16S rRNA processing protein RimM [Blautia sp.]|nr:16S rRNA processing protein RimM [Blautia sp.]